MTAEEIHAIIERETSHKVDGSTPIEFLGLDSLEFQDLLLTIEQETDRVIPEDADLHTVGDIVRAVLA